MNSYPCLLTLELISPNRRIEFFLRMAKSVHMDMRELLFNFEQIKQTGLDFGTNVIAQEDLKNHFENAPYGECNEIYKALISDFRIADFGPCLSCPFSPSYTNKNRNYEAIILKFLFANPNKGAFWEIKNPRTFFRSHHIIRLNGTDQTKLLNIQLFYRVFLAAKKHVAGSTSCGDACDDAGGSQISLVHMLSLIQSHLMVSSFRGININPDLIMQAISEIFMSELKKSGIITEQDFNDASLTIKKRHAYKRRAFIPDSMKPFGFHVSDDLPIAANFPSNRPATPSHQLPKDIPTVTSENEDTCAHVPLFDASGRVHIDDEIRDFFVTELHPHDIYAFLNAIRKEEWIGVESAALKGENGLLVLCGSERSAFFLSNKLSGIDILKCIFCRCWVVAIAMNATPLFAYMLERGMYIFPDIVSLSAKYNAAHNQEILNPVSELLGLIDSTVLPFEGSEIIQFMQNYGAMNLALGHLIEKTKRTRLEKNYLYYEFALGTAMDIRQINSAIPCNVKRINYVHNEFLFNGINRGLKSKTVCSFHLSLSAKGNHGDTFSRNSFMVHALSYIFKCSALWKYGPVLLFYSTDCLALCFNTVKDGAICIIEESVCRILSKNAKRFQLDAPFIYVTYHHGKGK